MSDVKLIKVYGVISDPGLKFTQSPIIDENAGPLTFASALHQKIQANLRKKVEITNFPYNLYFHLYYKKRIFHYPWTLSLVYSDIRYDIDSRIG